MCALLLLSLLFLRSSAGEPFLILLEASDQRPSLLKIARAHRNPIGSIGLCTHSLHCFHCCSSCPSPSLRLCFHASTGLVMFRV